MDAVNSVEVVLEHIFQRACLPQLALSCGVSPSKSSSDSESSALSVQFTGAGPEIELGPGLLIILICV